MTRDSRVVAACTPSGRRASAEALCFGRGWIGSPPNAAGADAMKTAWILIALCVLLVLLSCREQPPAAPALGTEPSQPAAEPATYTVLTTADDTFNAIDDAMAQLT